MRNAREKKPHVVVTFSSLDDAAECEMVARDKGIPGRIIPVPSEISAGCGMAWAVPAEAEADLRAALSAEHLPHEGVFTVGLYA